MNPADYEYAFWPLPIRAQRFTDYTYDHPRADRAWAYMRSWGLIRLRLKRGAR